MVRLGLLSAAFVVGMAAPAFAQDPYVDSVRRYRAERDLGRLQAYFATVKSLSFAASCKVVEPPPIILGAIRQLEFEFINRAMAYDELERNISRSMAEGRDQAKTDGCGYWASHPDQIIAMRELAYSPR